ncbi:MAG: ABC transporter permease [Polyangiaceae bacterium]|nr:ABC transporter permease [Polyangiaceae bacterium]
MITRALRRLGLSLLVLWAVVTLAFVINHVLPGDPARLMAGPQARPADVEKLRRELGTDRPLAAQYASFTSRLVHTGPRAIAKGDKPHASCSAFAIVHVDLGVSFQHRKPVARLIGERLPATALLASMAVAFEVLLAVGLGLLAARWRRTIVDDGVMAVSLLLASVPTFLTAVVLQVVFAYRLRWLPFDGAGEGAASTLAHAVLPALTLALYGAGWAIRLVRDEVISELGKPYVRTARAKGAGQVRVLLAHAMRNVALPLVTLVGLDLGALLGGAIVTERIFRWPGVGSLAIDAVVTRDGPVIMGTVIVASAGIVAANLAVDGLVGLIDPRTRRAAA